jgi:hypothetical protein
VQPDIQPVLKGEHPGQHRRSTLLEGDHARDRAQLSAAGKLKDRAIDIVPQSIVVGAEYHRNGD